MEGDQNGNGQRYLKEKTKKTNVRLISFIDNIYLPKLKLLMSLLIRLMVFMTVIYYP